MIANHPGFSLFGRGIRGLFPTIKRFRPLLALLACLLGPPALAASSDSGSTDKFTPTADFTDNGDGTVTHKLTGLTWMRCSMGQTWTGGTCSGTAGAYTWDAAKALTSSFAGKTDWRLPSPWELVSIVDYDICIPAINGTIFPNPPGSDFWSGSPFAYNSYNAWNVYFSYGYAYGDGRSSNLAVRLVRGGQSFGTLTTPTSDFTDNGDGTVTHKKTGLIWKRCAEGQTWTGSTCTGTATTYTYDQAVALTASFAGQSDWRTPDIQELVSIVEYGAYAPAINTTIFPNTPSSNFWSGSPDASSSYYAWYVHFSYGYASGSSSRSNGYAVRLVRGGQSFGSLASLTIAKSGSGSGIATSSPSGIDCGSTCSASFTVNSTVTLTATPASGSYFYGWSGACSGAGSCVVTMNEPRSVTATFKPFDAAGVLQAAEFYHAAIDHYFMTASTEEATYLDNNASWGWQRTGKTFNIWLTQASAPGNASPVCRFFGVFANGTVGSHFYTVDAAECDMVKGRLDWGWGYENNAFYAVSPVGGACPGGTAPVYRAYNNGMGGAPNHRYMASQADLNTMLAQGWVSEGIAFCGAQ